MSKEWDVGARLRQYIMTIVGECVGCIEVQVVQLPSGRKIGMIEDSHGGTGFCINGQTAPLERLHGLTEDEFCTLPDEAKRSQSQCDRCWFNAANMTQSAYGAGETA